MVVHPETLNREPDMRINVYAEELPDVSDGSLLHSGAVEVVEAENSEGSFVGLRLHLRQHGHPDSPVSTNALTIWTQKPAELAKLLRRAVAMLEGRG